MPTLIENITLFKKKMAYLSILSFAVLISCHDIAPKAVYQGQAYTPQLEEVKHQLIPGKIQCEYFDLGGEGVAFHDSDSINNGSGKLNKGTDDLSTFRIDEAVDISYTKFHNRIDNSEFNFVQPEEGQLYVGWTEPGEWINFSVEVKKTGIYRVGIMYTSNGNGQISFSVNNQQVTDSIALISTHVAADTIDWRQWHHWNYMENIAEISLEQGLQVLTLHTVTNGQMNYDFLSFQEKK